MNLRIAVNGRVLFDLTAETLGKSRSEFMLSASRKMAEATLMNRGVFSIDDSKWDAFAPQLDEAIPNPAEIEKLKSAPSPWKK